MAGNFSTTNPPEGQSNGTLANSTEESCRDRDKRDLPEEKLIIMISIKAILIIITVFVNSLVFKAFYKFLSLRTPSNVILVSLSVADSLIAIAYTLDISNKAIKLSTGQRSPSLCTASAGFTLLLISVIILHLALISVERLIAIKYSLRYHTIVTSRRALLASITVWMWAVVFTLVFPLALKASSGEAHIKLERVWHPCSKIPRGHPDDPPIFRRGYPIFLVISLFIVPLVIILCSYGYIYIVSRRHRKQIREQDDIPGITAMKNELRGARTLAIVVAVCLLSIVPLLVVISLRLFGGLPDRHDCHRPNRKYIKYIIYDVTTGLNAICNPLIYGWRNEKFRSAFRKLLKCA